VRWFKVVIEQSTTRILLPCPYLWEIGEVEQTKLSRPQKKKLNWFFKAVQFTF